VGGNASGFQPRLEGHADIAARAAGNLQEMRATDPQAVVVTGLYGVGKTTVVEEMAEQLESFGLAFGAVDLDWLWWFYVPGLDDDSVDRIGLANISAVVQNYIEAGVSHLLMAGMIEDDADIAALSRAIRCPLRVVRLTLPLAEIHARLAGAPTAGRQNDLRQAEEWVSRDFGAGIGDLVVANDRPIDVVAREILKWLEWI
jgi:hypothetical protein